MNIIGRVKKLTILVALVLLSTQYFITPIGMVEAETTTDSEQMELPTKQNYLEEEQNSNPGFFFTHYRMQGTVEKPLEVCIFSDQEVSEARLFLPEEATLLKQQLPTGISIEEGELPHEWIVQSKLAQNTFTFHLVFDEPGNYELSVEETVAHLEISEQEEISEEVLVEETEEISEEVLTEETENSKNDLTEKEGKYELSPKTVVSNDFNTIVTPDNMLDYFGLSGSARLSVAGNSIVTLTPDINSQSGSMYLKKPINSTFSFKLTGKVYLGRNSNSADGIGFGFHRDTPDSVGMVGSGFGLAGLKDVFGFKLDTFFNGTNTFPFRPDPISSGAFGAFVYMDNGWFTSYTGRDAPARTISRPSGIWKDINIMLTEESILRIEYENMVWEKEIPTNLNDSSLSFLISASTGMLSAQQQFQLESFMYSRASATVLVNYLDENGRKIHESTVKEGLVGDEYQTEPRNIPGFTLKHVPDNASGIFKEEVQMVNYIYESKIVSPVDPLDPESEVNPENTPELPEDQGQLSIDFVSAFNFGSQAISVHDQTYYAKPQRLINEDGTVNETEERPNYVQITDNRMNGERSGWSLSATLDEEGFRNKKNENLRGAQINLENQEVITSSANENTPKPSIVSPGVTLRPGVKQTLLEANSNEGKGTWIYRFGDRETAGRSVSLDVPKKSNPSAEKYQTTIKWELSTVPGNELD